MRSCRRVPRAGLVHRIDKDTSGLLVVARTLEAHSALVAALAAHEIEREYLALCTGAMTGGGTVDEPIGRHRTQRTKMAVRSDGRAGGHALPHREALPRAHAGARAARDRPHAPDPRAPGARRVTPSSAIPVYGGRRRLPAGATPALMAALEGFRRQALHAARLSFAHPKSGKTGHVRGAAARRLQRVVRRAGARPGRGAHVSGAGLLRFDWPLPRGVRAAFTTRCGGVSAAPWDSFNLAAHVGDAAAARGGQPRATARRCSRCPPSRPGSTRCMAREWSISTARRSRDGPVTADASITGAAGRVCVIMVADCLPVLFASRDGTRIGAAHAGWRGLAGGRAREHRRGARRCAAAELTAWLGPAISQRALRSGRGSARRLRRRRRRARRRTSRPMRAAAGRRISSALARRRLAALGVADRCMAAAGAPYADRDAFYSYRRDGRVAAAWPH